MSNDIEHLITLINSILQPNDKALRENSQKALVELRTSKPNELMMAFLSILAGNYPVEHRNFSATQLRLCLSTFAPASYQNLWKNLNPQNQNTIKTKLFEILFAEPVDTMKKHIADTLGEIAGSVINQNPQNWPQFKIHLWELFKQESFQSVMAGFFLLETFLPYSPQTFKDDQNDLYVLFKNGLSHENNKIKVSSLNAFSSFLEILEIKEQKMFKPLILDIFNAVYGLLVNDNFNDEGLEVLSEMLDVEYKFFKQNFKELNQLLQNVFKINNIQSGIKRMATQILVDFSEKSPALFRKNKEYLTGVIEMIFFHMVEIENEISDEWKCPPEGYNDNMDDDEDYETTRFGMNSIDRLIYSVGDKEVLPILSEAIKGLLAQPGWKYQYTAVMALSQIGQYMEDVTHISSIIEMIANYFVSENPMLRYASCHAIGQISDDMQPKFQESYGDLLYPRIVALLQDPIPRVVSHAAACLTNFLEGMKIEKASEYLDKLMEMLIYHATSGISLVKQSCLSTISSVAELYKSGFETYLQKTVTLLFNIIDTHTKKQYKQLRGQSIQTLTIIASSIGGEKFRPALDRLVNIMIAIQQSTFEQTDPQKSYILSGWQRLCLIYGKQLSGYLDRILPSLFALVQNVINTELEKATHHEVQTEEKDDKEKAQKESINTFQTQEAEVAIAMLNVFIQKLKQLYSPYVESTVTLICKIITDHINDGVRDQACKCLPSLVSAVKVSNVQTAIEMTKYFMETLIKTIESESDPEFICIQLETLKSVIEDLDLCFLNEGEISSFTQKILKILSDSEESKNVTEKYKRSEEELDEEDKELFDEEIKQEEEVQVAVSEVIGMLFKTHKDITLPLANYLITNILPNILKPGQSDNTYKLAIFMIDDMVEHLGYDRLQSNWFYFSTVLVNFTRQKNCEIRQAACYGLGILAERTPPTVSTTELVDGWLQQLINSSKIPKGNEKQKTFGHCRDNSVASIGKIIKTHGEKVNIAEYLKYWITFLPLRFDKPEAISQHGLLIDILLSKPQFILGNTEHDQTVGLHKVLSIYGTILNNQKIYNEEVKIKMKQHIGSLQTNSIFMNNREKIWNHLSEKERHNITELLK